MSTGSALLSRGKKLGKWLAIAALAYLLVGVALYFLQDKFLLHPEPLAADYRYPFTEPFKEHFIDYDSTTRFSIVQFTVADSIPKKGSVIYCHGNMDNVTHYAEYARGFTSRGYEVWMMDYPGFGKSTGAFTEQTVYNEVLQVYKMVVSSGTADTNVIIYGKSLGTGIAAQLASVVPCRSLILECPYFSIRYLAAGYAWMYPAKQMVDFNIPTARFLQQVTAPVTIFHGTDDETIPFNNAEMLISKAKPGDELVTIPGGHHNDLTHFPLMQQKLDSLLAR